MREKPKLYLDALIGRKIKVRAGEPININIPMSGAPTPTIEWTKNKLKVAETLRISVIKLLHLFIVYNLKPLILMHFFFIYFSD